MSEMISNGVLVPSESSPTAFHQYQWDCDIHGGQKSSGSYAEVDRPDLDNTKSYLQKGLKSFGGALNILDGIRLVADATGTTEFLEQTGASGVEQFVFYHLDMASNLDELVGIDVDIPKLIEEANFDPNNVPKTIGYTNYKDFAVDEVYNGLDDFLAYNGQFGQAARYLYRYRLNANDEPPYDERNIDAIVFKNGAVLYQVAKYAAHQAQWTFLLGEGNNPVPRWHLTDMTFGEGSCLMTPRDVAKLFAAHYLDAVSGSYPGSFYADDFDLSVYGLGDLFALTYMRHGNFDRETVYGVEDAGTSVVVIPSHRILYRGG